MAYGHVRGESAVQSMAVGTDVGSTEENDPLAEANEAVMRSRNRLKQHERRLYALVNRRPDMLWQENPPRVLAYRAAAVHQYGWIPLNPVNWRNVKATVFSSFDLNLQTVLLVTWTAVLHKTGLGINESDVHAFLKIWGTVYSGAVFNMATIVVFILGLFTTLVINRWWSIRTAHTKLSSSCIALAMQSAHTIRDPRDLANPHVNRARTELIRLINLAHVLVCVAADGANKAFAQRNYADFFVNLLGLKWVFGEEVEDLPLGHTMGALGYRALSEEGLVNRDEWKQILTNEGFGMPRYLTVMYWVEALLHQCRAADQLLTPQQALPSMLAKVNVILDSANTVFTFIRSQMPYPYVQLVSFTVHFYLFFWATYMGMLLFAGLPDGSIQLAFQKSVPTCDVLDCEKPDNLLTPQILLEALSDPTHRINQDNVNISVRRNLELAGWWSILWTYLTVAFANVVFQGLLNMHVLLDNPYGNHCCKFPLRAQVIEVLNATRTLLTRSDVLPAMFSDIFDPTDTNDNQGGAGEPDLPPGEQPRPAQANAAGAHVNRATHLTCDNVPEEPEGPNISSENSKKFILERELEVLAAERNNGHRRTHTMFGAPPREDTTLGSDGTGPLLTHRSTARHSSHCSDHEFGSSVHLDGELAAKPGAWGESVGMNRKTHRANVSISLPGLNKLVPMKSSTSAGGTSPFPSPGRSSSQGGAPDARKTPETTPRNSVQPTPTEVHAQHSHTKTGDSIGAHTDGEVEPPSRESSALPESVVPNLPLQPMESAFGAGEPAAGRPALNEGEGSWNSMRINSDEGAEEDSLQQSGARFWRRLTKSMRPRRTTDDGTDVARRTTDRSTTFGSFQMRTTAPSAAPSGIETLAQRCVGMQEMLNPTQHVTPEDTAFLRQTSGSMANCEAALAVVHTHGVRVNKQRVTHMEITTGSMQSGSANGDAGQPQPASLSHVRGRSYCPMMARPGDQAGAQRGKPPMAN